MPRAVVLAAVGVVAVAVVGLGLSSIARADEPRRPPVEPPPPPPMDPLALCVSALGNTPGGPAICSGLLVGGYLASAGFAALTTNEERLAYIRRVAQSPSAAPVAGVRAAGTGILRAGLSRVGLWPF